MKQFNVTQKKLLIALADGNYHKGNELGEGIGVSRAAICKQIKQLKNLGAPLCAHSKFGYKLKRPMHFLNQNFIQKNTLHPINLHLFASIDSTNRFLKSHPPSDAIDICCAETQTAGRGRFNRAWHSPFAENIYCSVRWHFDRDLSELSGLSLLVSLAVLKTLKPYIADNDLQIKWPNDILWNHKKLCGVLIEVVAESNDSANVIIGMGININSITEEQPPLTQPWCSLFDITGNVTDRNQILTVLISNLIDHLDAFKKNGFAPFLPYWHTVDALQGKKITVSHANNHITGRANGVSNTGQLLLIDQNNTTHCLSSGEASLLK